MNNIFPELPAKLGIYTLTELLAVKEHSERYLATQSYVDRAVIIEVLHPSSSDGTVAMFQESIRKRAAVKLPNVSPTLESAKTGNLRYLIAEQPAGKPFSKRTEEDAPLSLKQAFTFLQAVADMYCACKEQGVVALPLSPDDIYMDGDTFRFLSPVLAGEPTDEQRVAQMESLAQILENYLTEDIVTKSNISVIIHWLRHGYGNTPLEWGLLASSLSTLLAQKFAPQRDAVIQWDKLTTSRFKRFLRRELRRIRRHPVFASILLLLVVAPVIASGTLLPLLQEKEDLPAVTAEYVYCGSKGRVTRVMTRPVSIGEYSKFLQAFKEMGLSQKKELSKGDPRNTRSYEPLDWGEQCAAAVLEETWRGTRLSQNSPVRGVSYWAALAYARYMQGDLPTAEQLLTVREQTPSPGLEEWTSTKLLANLPYDDSIIVLPAEGKKEIATSDLDALNEKRTFRVSVEQPNRK